MASTSERRLPPVLVALILMAATTIVCAFGSMAFWLTDWDLAGDPYFPATEDATTHKVRFEVTGPGTAQWISWTVNGDRTTDDDARLPWTKELSATSTGPVGLTVTKVDGSIRCRLLIDGKVVADREDYDEVTCSATIHS